MFVVMEKILCCVLTLPFSFGSSSAVLGNKSVQGKVGKALDTEELEYKLAAHTGDAIIWGMHDTSRHQVLF